jgi:hypothetical protein
MFRNRFVWEVQVRREVLDDEIARLRDLPYSMWRDMLRRPMSKAAKGRDERTYRIRTTAGWAQEGSEDIRVEVVLETTRLHRRLLSQGFVITPDNRFLE